jgi:hypothetical protein
MFVLPPQVVNATSFLYFFCFIISMKLKSKISSVSVYKTNIHVKIKIDGNTQKRYNQFRQELINKYKIGYKGSDGFTKLDGKYMDVNVFKGEKYLHFIIYGKIRKRILNTLLNYFEYAEYVKP